MGAQQAELVGRSKMDGSARINLLEEVKQALIELWAT
jgi:hypothetical protein